MATVNVLYRCDPRSESEPVVMMTGVTASFIVQTPKYLVLASSNGDVIWYDVESSCNLTARACLEQTIRMRIVLCCYCSGSICISITYRTSCIHREWQHEYHTIIRATLATRRGV